MQSGGLPATDPPVAQTATPTGGPSNKKVARQARKAGADDGQTGGGTLFTEQVLVVNQKAKVFGSRLGYAVFNQGGQQLGTVQELRRDLSDHVELTVCSAVRRRTETIVSKSST